jgi:ABC-type glutathione transport system ATPase component
MVEAGISLVRVRSFLLCEDHKTVGPGSLQDIGISMSNTSCAYESKKPQPEGRDVDPVTKQLAEKNWEVSLLQSQLEDAETKIRELSKPKTSQESDSASEDTETVGYLSSSLLCLKRINFECKPGQLIAVVGGVGCGK